MERRGILFVITLFVMDICLEGMNQKVNIGLAGDTIS